MWTIYYPPTLPANNLWIFQWWDIGQSESMIRVIDSLFKVQRVLIWSTYGSSNSWRCVILFIQWCKSVSSHQENFNVPLSRIKSRAYSRSKEPWWWIFHSFKITILINCIYSFFLVHSRSVGYNINLCCFHLIRSGDLQNSSDLSTRPRTFVARWLSCWQMNSSIYELIGNGIYNTER